MGSHRAAKVEEKALGQRLSARVTAH